jgi:hypothetical protein
MQRPVITAQQSAKTTSAHDHIPGAVDSLVEVFFFWAIAAPQGVPIHGHSPGGSVGQVSGGRAGVTP